MFEKEEKTLQLLSQYHIEIGVISDNTDRKNDGIISIGITNAELMFIHENGSPTRNIPSRPVLQMTIDYAKSGPLDEELNFIIKNVIENDWEEKDIVNELNKFCLRLQEYAQDLIYSNDGRLIANAPRTAYEKWKKEKHSKNDKWQYPEGNHPLFDTGQLARSITCRIYKN